MKFAYIALALAPAAAAFVPVPAMPTRVRIGGARSVLEDPAAEAESESVPPEAEYTKTVAEMQDEKAAYFSGVNKLPKPSASKPVADPAANLPAMSTAIPMLKRPPLLTGELAGDVGFDPLGLADSPQNLAFYAEAEVKHARLAMLCAAGWPLSEIWHPQLASTTGLPVLTAAGGRAPSVLNGALFTQANGLVGLALMLLIGAALDIPRMGKESGTGWGEDEAAAAGDLGFDPLGVYGAYASTDAGKKLMRTAEIKNGRVAMVAVFAYVVEEISTGKPVTEITPLLFRPFYLIVLEMMGASSMGDGQSAFVGEGFNAI